MKESEARDLIAFVEAAYEHTFSAPTKNLWTEELMPLPLSATEAVIRAMVKTDRVHAPRVGEVIVKVMSFSLPSADEAWLQVLEQVRAVGLPGRPDFDHPAVTRAVQVIGWSVICNSGEADQWARINFQRVYDGVAQKAIADHPALDSGDRFDALVGTVTKTIP